MRREQAEKLLAALIFDDLDDVSKSELTAYLQTDDELRERLADMRMAVKVTSDTINTGPDPVLDKRRLRHLARLARRTSRPATVFTFRRLAVAAAILLAVTLPSVVIFNAPKFGKVHKIAQRGSSDGAFPLALYDEPSIEAHATDEWIVNDGGEYRRKERLEGGVGIRGGTTVAVQLPASGEVSSEIKSYSLPQMAGEDVGDKQSGISYNFRGAPLARPSVRQGQRAVDRLLSASGDEQPFDTTSTFDMGTSTSPMDASGQIALNGNAMHEEVPLPPGSVGQGTNYGDSHFAYRSDSGFTTIDGDSVSDSFVVDSGTETSESATREEAVAGGSGYYGTSAGGRVASDHDALPGIQAGYGTYAEKFKADVPAKDANGERYFDSYFESPPIALTIPPSEGIRHDSIAAVLSSKRLPAGSEYDAPVVTRSPQPLGAPPSTTGEPKVPILGDLPVPGRLYSDRSPASEAKKPAFVGTPTNVIKGKDSKLGASEDREHARGREVSGSGIAAGLVPDTPVDARITREARPVINYPDNWSEQGSRRTQSDQKSEAADAVSEITSEYAGKEMEAIVDSSQRGSFNEKARERGQLITMKQLQDRVSKEADGSMVVLEDSIVTGPVGGPEGAASASERDKRLAELKKEAAKPIHQDETSSDSDYAKDILNKIRSSTAAVVRPPALEPVAVKQPVSGLVITDSEPDLPPASRFKAVPVNPWVMTQNDSLSTFGLDVDTASYTLCRRYIRGGFLPPAGAVRMEEFINYFNYNYPQRSNPTFTVHADAVPSPFAERGRDLTLLKIGVKARTVGRDQRKTAHLVLVVDASASMGQPDRLGLVQHALNLLVDRLADNDRVTLITCASEARLHMASVPASRRNEIKQAINAIQPAGSTNLLAGLKLGYAIARRDFSAKQINRVVLCSDGVANVGETESELILKEVAEDRKQGIAITCVGVGYGSYNDIFLESLANQGDGSYVFLDSPAQARKVFVEQLAATLNNVAKDARIQVKFNPERVRRYRLIGYENRDIEDKRFRDDTVDAGEVGSGQCSTALYELELTHAAASAVMQEIGTVFVRYRNADTDRIEEISSELADKTIRKRSIKSDPRFFLAASAARFAEILRQSEHARNANLNDVLAVMENVSVELGLDRDVEELLQLVRAAEGLPRAP